MQDIKSLWRSKSFWAGALGFLASLAGIIGIKIDPARSAELADMLPLVITNVTSASGVVFRILADARVSAAAKSKAQP